MKTTINLAGFQLFWWFFVWGASQGFAPALLALGLVAYLALHFSFVATRERWREWRAILACAALGLFCDAALTITGVMNFHAPYLLPLWLVLMWLHFPTALGHSLAWLRGRAFLAAVLGAVGGPLAYATGKAFALIEFPHGLLSFVAIAGMWALLVPTLVGIYWKVRSP